MLDVSEPMEKIFDLEEHADLAEALLNFDTKLASIRRSVVPAK